MEHYLSQVQNLSYEFISLLAEAFGLPPDGLAHFYDTDDLMQHRAKIVQYPVVDDSSSDQGVGPHYDAGFLTFVCTFLHLGLVGSYKLLRPTTASTGITARRPTSAKSIWTMD